MRLKLRYVNEGKEPKQDDPFEEDFVHDEEDPMLNWVADQEAQDPPVLDEPGDPPRPCKTIAYEIGVRM